VVVVVGLLGNRAGAGAGVGVSGLSEVAGVVAVSGVRALLAGMPSPVVAGVVVDKGEDVGVVPLSVPVTVDVVGVAEAMDVVVAVDGLVVVAVTTGVPVVEVGAVAEMEMGGVAVALTGVAEALVDVADATGVAIRGTGRCPGRLHGRAQEQDDEQDEVGRAQSYEHGRLSFLRSMPAPTPARGPQPIYRLSDGLSGASPRPEA